jgi:opacity protein-like surface antigen
MKRILAAVVVTVVLAGVVPPARAASIVLPRSGQVGFAVQGLYGGLTNGGTLGQEFGSGPGVAVQLRYRMRYERAIGLSFDAVTLDTRRPRYDATAFPASTPTDSLTRSSLTVQTYGFDVYQFFSTRTRTPKYVLASAGLVHPYGKLSDGETVYTESATDGFYVGVGGGLERFVYRSWAIDANVGYKALLYDGQTNHLLRASLGVILYAAY